MIRLEPEVKKFIDKKFSPTMADAEKLSMLVRIGMELFDVIEEIKRQLGRDNVKKDRK